VEVSSGAVVLAVFLACAVEAVEALTIVLAAGTARDWRSAGSGVICAVVVLAVIVAALGPALSALPLGGMRLVVGGLLLVFGLQWLRKAVLRASGLKALHDETEAFATELAAAKAVPSQGRGAVRDWCAFTLSFKGVFLEGLEVAFIALTFGSNQHDVALAAGGGGAVRGGRGDGRRVRDSRAACPGAGEHPEVHRRSDVDRVRCLLGQRGRWGGMAGFGCRVVSTGASRRAVLVGFGGHAAPDHRGRSDGAGTGEDGGFLMAWLRKFFAFWYDFVVGDDWRAAAAVVVALAITYGVSRTGAPSWWILPVAVILVLPLTLWRAARRH
jgi:hypothetical protein